MFNNNSGFSFGSSGGGGGGGGGFGSTIYVPPLFSWPRLPSLPLLTFVFRFWKQQFWWWNVWLQQRRWLWWRPVVKLQLRRRGLIGLWKFWFALLSFCPLLFIFLHYFTRLLVWWRQWQWRWRLRWPEWRRRRLERLRLRAVGRRLRLTESVVFRRRCPTLTLSFILCV